MRVRVKEEEHLLYSSPWFFIPKPSPRARLRLFCFPYAGGAAELYYPWSLELPDDIEMVAIQYPGHIQGTQDKLYTRLSALVEDLYLEISRFLDLDYAFFGHSMGALVAYRLSVRLSGVQAKMPSYLFLSARNPPHLPIVHPQTHLMTDAEYVSLLRAFNVLPEVVVQNHGLLQIILPILRADFEMIETWQYDPGEAPLNVPVCAFAGVNDTLALPSNMAKWQQYTVKAFRMLSFPEKHYFILNKEIRRILMDNVVRLLR